MRTLLKLLIPIGVFAIAVTTAFGQLSFDEFGNGAFGPGVLGPDPTGGFLGGPVMIYPLAFPGTAGDVLLHDGAINNPFLDVIRFTGNGQLIFYSDNVDGFDAPADTAAAPNPLFPNQVNLVEPINEGGVESVLYTPLPGQPGFDPAFNPTYNFISDVPEPASIMLVGLSLVGLLAVIRRRK